MIGVNGAVGLASLGFVDNGNNIVDDILLG